MSGGSFSYTPDPTEARARAEECYGSTWFRYTEVRYSDPVDWSWNEERWLRDALYHAAVRFVIGWLEAVGRHHHPNGPGYG